MPDSRCAQYPHISPRIHAPVHMGARALGAPIAMCGISLIKDLANRSSYLSRKIEKEANHAWPLARKYDMRSANVRMIASQF